MVPSLHSSYRYKVRLIIYHCAFNHWVVRGGYYVYEYLWIEAFSFLEFTSKTSFNKI